MEQISIFDIIKIGIGPSSSHTMGPWRAALRSLRELENANRVADVTMIQVDLYGSLAKTGRGHGTGLSIILGLMGEDPLTINPAEIFPKVNAVREKREIPLAGRNVISFAPVEKLVYRNEETLPFHPNGLRITYTFSNDEQLSRTYFSIGGGFIVEEGETEAVYGRELPYPCHKAQDVLRHCTENNKLIWEIVRENELTWRNDQEIDRQLDLIWETMQACVYRGCYTSGILPGGLEVKRRAPELNRKLLGVESPKSRQKWINKIRNSNYQFREILKWVSCFAIATNEENAAFGRVVTAPTNGASGVIPAVLFYFNCFCKESNQEAIRRFLLVAGELGSLFKKGATISAAMGGCQAEIGVSSAMAAGALTECLGGTPAQSLMAAEIAMEHHLGLTCDPIGGLVQIPCIERNSMGAIKAITAANIALESDPQSAKVTLDSVIKSMWETAKDMNAKYKETSEGGLALSIPINVIEC